jgi:hypothetical protein
MESSAVVDDNESTKFSLWTEYEPISLRQNTSVSIGSVHISLLIGAANTSENILLRQKLQYIVDLTSEPLKK